MADPVGTPFDIHVDAGDVTGLCWHGKFRAKPVLSFNDQFRVERIKRDLLGAGSSSGMDEETVARAEVLAELQVRLTEVPTWWEGGLEHSDTNLLLEIYKEVKKVTKEHIENIKKQGEEARGQLKVK